MFDTELSVRHIEGKRWQLTSPLVWSGKRQLFVAHSDFETDFASIPKALRWLLDNAGANSEAAVLHDAAWRESVRPTDTRRIDPADADGMFRRALRETGSTALTRGLMWGGVRAASIVRGRYGTSGPGRWVKLAQLGGVGLLGILTILAPTLVTLAGLVFYWAANWIVAIVWRPFEKRTFGPDFRPNWPWWPRYSRAQTTDSPRPDLLEVLEIDSEPAKAIRDLIKNHQIADTVLRQILARYAIVQQ